ncbi:MAG: leucyl aminopeptidase [Planctomycetales bacterium]
MELKSTSGSVTQAAESVVVGAYQGGELNGPAAEVDQASGGLLKQLIEAEDISGKLNETVNLFGVSGMEARQVVVVGLGEREKLNRQAGFQAAASASRFLAGKKHKQAAFYLDDGWPEDVAEAGISGALVGCVGQDLYRAEKKRHPFETLLWSRDDESTLARGRALGESVNLTRRLVNEPPEVMYPESFATEAEKVAADAGLECEVWDEQRLQEERCGSLLAVAKGSDRPARLVILRYRGGGDDDPTLALVGKGVTFDSGGLSLKPSEGMLAMKCDMAGAATVLGAMNAIGKLKPQANVMGVMGLVENLPSGKAMKLGDVLNARNGRTIEVHNTDAEGRLVLADALAVAIDHGASNIIDLATLTGACMVALGLDVAGMMSNNQAWCDRVLASAKECGELAWQLPMFSEYNDLIKSEVADIKNLGEGRWGGAITAAKFLEQFVGDTPWTHIDIAGPAFLDKPRSWVEAGGSGCFVRSLVHAAQNFNN